MTNLDKIDFENFWIRCYLPSASNLIDRAIKRAYLDFNRTAHGINIMKSPEKYPLFSDFLKKLIEEITTKKFENQKEFDKWHKKNCNSLISLFNDSLNYDIYIGQAQKWINMTFKYLFALGDNRIPGISTNYNFFHIPIDRIIQIKLLEKQGITILNLTWSRIDNYQDYLNYQERVRNEFYEEIPMDIEFKLFNE